MEKLLSGLNMIMQAMPDDEELQEHFRQVIDRTEAMLEMIVELRAQVRRLEAVVQQCQSSINDQEKLQTHMN